MPDAIGYQLVHKQSEVVVQGFGDGFTQGSKRLSRFRSRFRFAGKRQFNRILGHLHESPYPSGNRLNLPDSGRTVAAIGRDRVKGSAVMAFSPGAYGTAVIQHAQRPLSGARRTFRERPCGPTRQAWLETYLLDQVRAAVIATDLQGTVTYWNHHAETLYGWSRDEALGQSIGELLIPEDQLDLAEAIMNRVREGHSWEGEMKLTAKDGASLLTFVSDSPILDAEGELVGIVGISSDITERRRVELESPLGPR